jgi:hypothetical protein
MGEFLKGTGVRIGRVLRSPEVWSSVGAVRDPLIDLGRTVRAAWTGKSHG